MLDLRRHEFDYAAECAAEPEKKAKVVIDDSANQLLNRTPTDSATHKERELGKGAGKGSWERELGELEYLSRAARTLETRCVSHIRQLPKAGKSPCVAQCEYHLN